MVTFYYRFLHHIAHILRPQYEAQKGKTRKQPVDWTAERVKAFKDTKAALARAAMLAHPSTSAPTALTTDASDFAVGAMYEQWVGDAWQPLAIFSRQLSPRERRYSTFDRELLGLWLAVRHFRFLLEGREFTAYVDHKPLTHVMSKTAEFTTDIQHVAGKSNVVADCLSRAVVGAVQQDLDYSRMAVDQAADPSIQALKSSDTGLSLEEVLFSDAGATLLCDVSTGQPRPVVPANWRRPVFDAVHGLSHSGRKPSSRLVSGKFVWHGLKRDVRAWVDTCTACQRAKVHRHVKAPLVRFSVPERRFDHVNVDLVGPLPPSHGFTYLFTTFDRTARWPEAVPLSSTTAPDLARAFIAVWVSRYGTPADLSSDCGPQFTSELWAAVAENLGVKLHHTTAYHPQANGLVERFHRSMKAALRGRLRLTDGNWLDKLPWVMLGLRTAPKEDLQSSSAELVFGQPLRVPGDFIPKSTEPWSASAQRASLLDGAKAFAPGPDHAAWRPCFAGAPGAAVGRLCFHPPRRPQDAAATSL